VSQSGAGAVLLPVARDQSGETRALIERGLAADILLISGGVSAGSTTWWRCAARAVPILFRLRMQPASAAVSASRGKVFLGLPGNPPPGVLARGDAPGNQQDVGRQPAFDQARVSPD